MGVVVRHSSDKHLHRIGKRMFNGILFYFSSQLGIKKKNPLEKTLKQGGNNAKELIMNLCSINYCIVSVLKSNTVR